MCDIDFHWKFETFPHSFRTSVSYLQELLTHTQSLSVDFPYIQFFMLGIFLTEIFFIFIFLRTKTKRETKKRKNMKIRFFYITTLYTAKSKLFRFTRLYFRKFSLSIHTPVVKRISLRRPPVLKRKAFKFRSLENRGSLSCVMVSPLSLGDEKRELRPSPSDQFPVQCMLPRH